MFLGRFAVAMAGKKFASAASLGTLVLSTQFADCLWPVLLLLGIEQVRIVPGTTRVTPLDFISYPISHSLLLQLVWGLLLGGAYFFWRRDLRTAPVVGALLPTHWLLDYFAHRPDMPLYPGGPKVGLGRSEEHTSELQSRLHLVCRLLLEKKKIRHRHIPAHIQT